MLSSAVYKKYINPWIRLLVILPILYLYSICSTILTYRHNKFQRELKCHKRLVLPDLLFDLIPAASLQNFSQYQYFVDGTPLVTNLLFFVVCLRYKSKIHFVQYIVIQMVMFIGNSILHVVTTLPDSNGLNPACGNSMYKTLGFYMWYNFTTNFCGDMIWSGHTSNTLLAMILIVRILSFNVVKTKWTKTITSINFTNRTNRTNQRCSVKKERVILLFTLWMIALIYCMVKIRFHYTVDILIAVFVTFLVSCNTPLVDYLISSLYFPVQETKYP